jgi:hypothetical protein
MEGLIGTRRLRQRAQQALRLIGHPDARPHLPSRAARALLSKEQHPPSPHHATALVLPNDLAHVAPERKLATTLRFYASLHLYEGAPTTTDHATLDLAAEPADLHAACKHDRHVPSDVAAATSTSAVTSASAAASASSPTLRDTSPPSRSSALLARTDRVHAPPTSNVGAASSAAAPWALGAPWLRSHMSCRLHFVPLWTLATLYVLVVLLSCFGTHLT